MTLKFLPAFSLFVTLTSHFVFFSRVRISVAVLRTQEPRLGTKARLLTMLAIKKTAPTQVQGPEAQLLHIAPKPVSILSILFTDMVWQHWRPEKGRFQLSRQDRGQCPAVPPSSAPPSCKLGLQTVRKAWHCFHFYFMGFCSPPLLSLIQMLSI